MTISGMTSSAKGGAGPASTRRRRVDLRRAGVGVLAAWAVLTTSIVGCAGHAGGTASGAARSSSPGAAIAGGSTAASTSAGAAVSAGPETTSPEPAFERAREECIERAVQATSNVNPQGVASKAAIGIYIECMKQKGFEVGARSN